MTYRELNQIFYQYNKFDSPNEINKLESFFYDMHILPSNEKLMPLPKSSEEKPKPMSIPSQKLSEEKQKPIQKLSEEKLIPNQKLSEEKPMPMPMPKLSEEIKMFEPKQKDSIFWCIFIYIYGYGEYLTIGSRYGNRELEEKQKMIAYFKENPKCLKTTNHKITNGNIQEIYSEYLSFQNETTLMGVIGLAVYYNIRILLVDSSKNIYLDYHTHTNDTSTEIKTCILYKNKGIRGQTKYCFDMSMSMNENIESDEKIKNTMLCLEHYTKPLKAISTYKSCDLDEIVKKLNINDESIKKIKKQELYNKIVEHCGTF
jgi:hypothetical protein